MGHVGEPGQRVIVIRLEEVFLMQGIIEQLAQSCGPRILVLGIPAFVCKPNISQANAIVRVDMLPYRMDDSAVIALMHL